MNIPKITYKLFAFLALIVALSACRKDMSTMDVNKIQGVEIDTAGKSTLSVFQFDTLVVKPVLKTGDLPSADLSYEWKINIAPRSLDYDVIGTSKDLDFEVRLKPTKTNEFHQIFYTVTDNKTGLKYIMSWPLAIRNSIGEGLVIAESADGINTDISHMMSPLVTPDFDEISIKRKVYSSINGFTIPGLVKQLRFSNLKGSGAVMMGITDNSLFTIKTLDYTAGPMNEGLFFTTPDVIKPQTLAGLAQVDVYVGNNQIHAVWLAISNKIGLPYASSYSVPDHIALNRNNNYPPIVLNFYDEKKGLFVYQPSISSFGDRKMHPVPSVAGEPFNPGSLPNKINLAAGVNAAGDFMHVLKDKSSNKVGLYIINAGTNDANWNLIPPFAKSFFDLSNAPDINNAVRFVLLDDQKVIYYATKTKIYAMMYGGATPTFSERYTVSGGEEITTLQIYQQSDYPLRSEGWDPPYLNTNNKQLVMSTYGSEGKVYLLPMINPGVANIDVANIKSYAGFGRISAISTQR